MYLILLRMLSRIHKSHQSTLRAFGLVELLVSISIMAMVMGVTITRQSSFNGAILLRNQAYELAFTLRQAQLLAVSGGDESVRSYGVFIDRNADTNAYVLFADVDENKMYDSAIDTQLGLIGRIDNRFFVRRIENSAGSGYGNPAITFQRPNFDAHLCNTLSGCSGVGQTGPFYIDIARVGTKDSNGEDGAGDVRRVEITATGQITVVTY
jgi:type II secretory pathway pseudopilin PulG